MRRLIPASVLLVILVAGGCGGGTTGGDANTAQPSPTPTQTKTVTKEPTGTATEEPPATVTKEPPPPATTTRETPPGSPAPEGTTDVCTYTSSQPEISSGSSGAAVKQAQCYLNLSMSGENLAEDGVFGPVTDAATKRFQRCAGITVDGLIGPETWSNLVFWASSPTPLC